MKYRLEELKRRYHPEVQDRLLVHLMTVEYDFYVAKIKEEHADNEDEFERLKDACIQDVR